MDSPSHLIAFNDGHKPGSTENDTKLVINTDKKSSKFLSVFDNLLADVWCLRAYEYSLKKSKPWGELMSDQWSGWWHISYQLFILMFLLLILLLLASNVSIPTISSSPLLSTHSSTCLLRCIYPYF